MRWAGTNHDVAYTCFLHLPPSCTWSHGFPRLTPETVHVFPRLTLVIRFPVTGNSTCFPALDFGHMVSRAWHREQYMFSRAWFWSHVFARLTLVSRFLVLDAGNSTCFPALNIPCLTLGTVHVFPRLTLVTCFPVFESGNSTCFACFPRQTLGVQYMYVFPPLTLVTCFPALDRYVQDWP